MPELPPYDMADYDVACYLARKHRTHYQDELRNKRPGFQTMAEQVRKHDAEWVQTIKNLTERPTHDQ